MPFYYFLLFFMATNGNGGKGTTESVTVDELFSVLGVKGKEWAVYDDRHTGLTIAQLRGVCDIFNMTSSAWNESGVAKPFNYSMVCGPLLRERHCPR